MKVLFSVRPALRWLVGLVLLLAGCVEPYMPDIVTTPPKYLVVDGFINSQGITSIKLSRTYAVAAAPAPPTESRATVYIEEEAGTRYLLRETTTGTYTSAVLALNAVRPHRLHILTQDGKDYASDYVPVKTTPPIDDVLWRAGSTGLSVFVNAHDATNATRYYRWEYDETWEISSPYFPSVEYASGIIRPITVLLPLVCWVSSRSNTVSISKTTALTQDVVSEFPLRRLPTTDARLRRLYSIQVQQHALTREEYAYWELLRKNTESIGTLMDPLPSQLTGNIHCLNDKAALALGFIGAHTLTEKRIFVYRSDLPSSWQVLTGYEDCGRPDTVNTDRSKYPGLFGGLALLPIEPVFDALGVINGYTFSSAGCVDCRKRGTSTKPSFWP